MEFAMLTIHVAMIIAMPGALAVAVPAPMLRSMVALLIAMIFAMLPPIGIGRMKVAMILPDIAMIVAVATARIAVAVAHLLNLLDVWGLFDLLHLALGAWRALDDFKLLHALNAHRARIAISVLLRTVVRRTHPLGPLGASLADAVG